MMPEESLYKNAGVDIDLATELLNRVKPKIASARRPEMLAPIGGFGGLFQMDLTKYKEPVLVASIDGVGTKLMVADMVGKFDTVGHDIVNHCINDIGVQGAEPIYFLDYIGIGKLRSPLYEEVLGGIADACKEANCTLLGGETAEMPGMYGNDFDLVGIITGVVEKSKLIDASNVQVGDVLVGIASTGVHSNGFSLVRKVLSDNSLDLNAHFDVLGNQSLGETLLTPTRIYVRQVLEVIRSCNVHGVAHITGGGFDENIPRILQPGQGFSIQEGTWQILPIFRLLEQYGHIPHREMFNIFNMGIGMVLAMPRSDAEQAIAILAKWGDKASVIGEVVTGDNEIRTL